MFTFFYNSLDTLKKVKAPTWSEVGKMFVSIFIVVMIASLLFSLVDGLFAELYKTFYHAMTGK